MKHKIFIIIIITAMVWLAGCPQPQPPRDTLDPTQCSGKATIDQAVRTLKLQRQNVRSFKAGADCTVYFPDEDGGLKPEAVDAVAIRFMPPDKMFFRGDKAFQEIRFGTNESEFWLRVKPVEDTYWYGSRSLATQCTADLLVNPYNVVEALGLVDVTTDWRLTYRNGYDLLDKLEGDKVVKRIYVDACTYTIRRIEYFDTAGALRVSANLSDYTTGENGIVVPSTIYIANYDDLSLETASVEIKLRHVAPIDLTKKRKLFVRPGRDGYKYMYELKENCEFEPVD
ncbi:MAG: hypothetical protein ACYSUT_05295 [Planctomycetota bacterium]|jgi:hypothetical protein